MNDKVKKPDLPPPPEPPKTTSFYGTEEDTREMEAILKKETKNTKDDWAGAFPRTRWLKPVYPELTSRRSTVRVMSYRPTIYFWNNSPWV